MPESNDPSNSESSSFLDYIMPNSFYTILREERSFLMLIGFFFFVAGITYDTPQIAMWVGFFFAAYSAIANDSIQTIGTFIASNGDKKWWVLWLFMGGIFLVTAYYSWITYGGDVTYERLSSKGFEEAPDEFVFLQVAAPIFLLIITRLRMPVSTTFLILSCFSANAEGIAGVLGKSLQGYGLAFVVAIIVWILFSRLFDKILTGEASFWWTPVQWIISGALWAVWLMQDAANIAVYLPRSLSGNQFLMFAGVIFFGLGVLFYLRGDRIQQIVLEKSHVVDVRAATMIDFIYVILLYYFKVVSTIPMSTTWVFIGLLAGREIGMSFTKAASNGKPLKKSFQLMLKDFGLAMIGLIVSITLALAINPDLYGQVVEYLSS